MTTFTEEAVEQATLAWLTELGYETQRGPDIAPDALASERDSYGDVLLEGRFLAALERLNPALPAEALEEAANKIRQTELPELVAENRRLHQLMTKGVGVESQREDGSIGGESVRLIDFDDPANNDWLAVNQFTVIEHGHRRIPDVVLFVNGLPIGVIELKNPTNEDADLLAAHNCIFRPILNSDSEGS